MTRPFSRYTDEAWPRFVLQRSPRNACPLYSMCPLSSMYRHAVVITPVARWVLIACGADYSNRFPFIPSDGGLPHPSAWSASTLVVSRPAQRSLALRPVGLLHRLSDASVSKAPTVSLPPPPLRSLPAGATQLPGGN